MLSSHVILTFLTYFPIYAFLGWCLEVIYASVNTGKFVNRGFLNGAVCPIYGVGAVLFIIFLTPLSNHLPLLFLASVTIASLLELVGGYMLEKLFHMRWWDYTEEPFNIGGFICLKFSLMWGLAGVFLMKLIQPMIAGILSHLPTTPVLLIICIFYLILITDCLITIIAIAHLNRDLKQVHDLSRLIRAGSDTLAENLGTFAVDTSEKLDNRKDELVENLTKELEELLSHQTRIRARILKAFPNAKHDRDRRALDTLRARYEARRKK
ncbi:putative ABC transporter permease [Lactococcus carnosus]|uniref:putative ABC transporter permease n=1 Tax=Pseudolactococcus carnosus TaxID=2749961 RepID=UPI001FB99895|nr:putative ABC transporter permease [Lactococcus carnosus]MCJ1980313.1 putative ABC transporter permease [Lactococcus carnosus]